MYIYSGPGTLMPVCGKIWLHFAVGIYQSLACSGFD